MWQEVFLCTVYKFVECVGNSYTFIVGFVFLLVAEMQRCENVC